jgi:hypothetical protein
MEIDMIESFLLENAYTYRTVPEQGSLFPKSRSAALDQNCWRCHRSAKQYEGKNVREGKTSESGSLVSSTRKHRRPRDRKEEYGNGEDESH